MRMPGVGMAAPIEWVKLWFNNHSRQIVHDPDNGEHMSHGRHSVHEVVWWYRCVDAQMMVAGGLGTVQGQLTAVDITLFRYKAISSAVLMPLVLWLHWYIDGGVWDGLWTDGKNMKYHTVPIPMYRVTGADTQNVI